MSTRTVAKRLFPTLLLLCGILLVTAVPALAATAQSADRICTGNNLTIQPNETVNNVLAFGCNVTIAQGATVTGDASGFGANFRVAGAVNGSVSTVGGNVFVESTGVVNGNVSALGGAVASAPGATIGGRSGSLVPSPVVPNAPVTPFVFPFTRSFDVTPSLSWGFNLIGSLVTALAFAALGALIVVFAPEPTRRVGSAVSNRPLGTAGVGCLTFILLPVLCILLMITVIGIPVAFLLGILALIAWIFGWISLGYLAGERILSALRTQNILPVVAVVLGVIVLSLISQIPLIGWLIGLIVGLFGIGAVVLTRFGTRPYPVPPTAVLVPLATAAAGTVSPSGYTPSQVDLAAWEEKARQAQARDVSATENPAAAPTAPATDVNNPTAPATDSVNPTTDAPNNPPSESNNSPGETPPTA